MFGIFFKKQALELKVESVNEYLDSEFSSQKDELETKLKSYVQEVNDIFNQIEMDVNLLSSRTTQNAYSNTVKQRFCEKSMESINLVKSFSGTNVEFIRNAQNSMRAISELNLRDFRHLHSFKDEMAKIAEKIKLLETRINYAAKSISSTQLGDLQDIKNKVNLITENQTNYKGIDSSLIKLNASLEQAESNLKEMQVKIDEMSADFSRYAEDKMKMREFEAEQNDIRQKISNEFSGMDRVMKKFLYFGDITKEESHKLQEYIRDAGVAFLEDSENMINSLLDKMHSFRDMKTIEMDESKHEKLKDIMRHMKILVEMKQKYCMIDDEKAKYREELEKKSEPIARNIRELNSLLNEKHKETNLLKSRIQSMINEKQFIEKETAEMIRVLQINLSRLLEKDIKIVA